MKIILDTNIYLNFYRLNGGQSLEMLKNINQFIEDGKFKLILPRQIEDEFVRNKNSRGGIYGDHILNFQKGLEVELKIPYLIKSSQKIEQIKNTVKRLKGLKEKAVEDYKNRVFNPNSKINQQLNKLFSRANRPTETDAILQHAWFRTLRGNPPRKNNSSFGDAIIWETILDQCLDDDLILISGDGDFASEIESSKMHELLEAEWKQKTEKKLNLYKKLGIFINERSKKKKKPIKKETIEEEDRLNSIFTASSHIVSSKPEDRYGVVMSGGVKLGEEDPSYMAVSGISGKNKCSCCGAQINSTDPWNILGSNKCDNCKESFSPSYTCSKCGRHFHSGITSINNGKCDKCQHKI
ncbi:MAG: DUF4935 domain-containing protein [Parcubacteria group bacterium]|nr:DUF4935 domain-containing protein [Parcubacteria group bacterium]